MGLLTSILKQMSGTSTDKVSKQLLYDKVIAFKGLANGVGTSTIVQSVAKNIAGKTKLSVCVIDTNFLYPTLFPFLVTGVDEERKDLLDFKSDLTDIVVETNIKGVDLISMYNRGMVDLLSNKDSEITINALISAVKSYYDVVLIDLSNELSQISTISAIKSNKLFLVSDQSMRTIYNLRKTLNGLSTLGVPVIKSKNVILNKVIKGVNSNTGKVLTEAGLNVVGTIHNSNKIATKGITGATVYDTTSVDPDILKFNKVIDDITANIIGNTELISEYISEEPKDEE